MNCFCRAHYHFSSKQRYSDFTISCSSIQLLCSINLHDIEGLGRAGATTSTCVKQVSVSFKYTKVLGSFKSSRASCQNAISGAFMFIFQRYDFCRAHYQLSSNNDTATSQFSHSTATVLCSINLLDSDIRILVHYKLFFLFVCLFVCLWCMSCIQCSTFTELPGK